MSAHGSDELFRTGKSCLRPVAGLMKLSRSFALTAALMSAAVASLTSPAHAWDLGWGGWGWGGVAVGLAPDGTGFGYAPNIYSAPYATYAPAYNYGSPAYAYGYGTGYSSPVYGGYRYAGYHPIVRHTYASAVVVRHQRRY